VIVVDASAAVELLLQSPQGERVEQRILAGGETLHTPHLVDLEVTQALRRLARIGEISAERGRQALADLGDLPLNRYPHNLFLSRIWDLRTNVTAYDAAYIALAEALPAALVTCDARLAAAPGLKVAIEVF
jgi:predicted nucleic acid-binding protein